MERGGGSRFLREVCLKFRGACNLARESECYVMEIITLSLSLFLSRGMMLKNF